VNETPNSITIIIPVFNEEAGIERIVPAFEYYLSHTTLAVSILFVNDGSTDSSLVQIKKVCTQYDYVDFISFEKNPGLINDTHRVTDWISVHKQAESRVYIYDKRLPSVLFNSNLQVISVFDGDESLNRETQFQQDQNWKAQLIDLKSNPNWIISSAPHRSIWIVKSKKQLPETEGNVRWQQLKEIDGWRVVRLLKK